jgi:hypothetical protein
MYFGFSKQRLLSKCIVVIELGRDEIHLQIMLSDIGYNSFKRPIVFCAEKKWEY